MNPSDGVQLPTSSDQHSPLRVFIYSRVSSAHQAEHGMSIESQPEALRSWAESQGWHISGELTDPGRTGRNDEREGFQSLMRSLKAYKPDAVLVTRLSRFMRNARLTLNAIHDMRQIGVALICKDEPIDTRRRGISDMFLAILATMAEWESDRMSEYAKDTRQRLVSKGRWPSGPTPYGYAYEKMSGHLVLVTDQAEVVRLMFSLYTDGRMGMNAIQRELAARGIRAPRGGKVWATSKIWQVLSDEVYIGRHRLGIDVPPIVDEEVFHRAQRLRRTNKHLHPPRKDKWPLQNRLRCSECGSTFRCSYSRGKRYYRCSANTITSRHFIETGERCPARSYRAEDLEWSLLSGICDSMFVPRNFAKALESTISELRTRKDDLERGVGPLREALEDAEAELRRIELAWVRGRLTADELSKLEKDALERRERTQARLESLAPDDLDELERTRSLLEAAQRSQEMAQQSGDVWGFNEAPPLWFASALTSFSSNVDVVSDDPSDSEVTYDTMPPISPSVVAERLKEMLDRLQAEVWAETGRLSLKGVINISIPPSEPIVYPGTLTRSNGEGDNQAFSSTSRTE